MRPPAPTSPPARVLFRVVDPSQVHVVGQVPEAEARARARRDDRRSRGPRRDDRLPAGRLVSVGQVLDPQARTLPITFAFDNRTRRSSRGAGGHAPSADGHHRLTAVDSRGRRRGRCRAADRVRADATARRSSDGPSRSGRARGDVVQVTDGVKAGERVVTQRRVPRASRVALDLGACPRPCALSERDHD